MMELVKKLPYVLKLSECRHLWLKNGRYLRSSDHRWIQKFRCKLCFAHRSEATGDVCFKQKKRHINAQIYGLLVSGVSQRRSAEILCVNRKTIIHKFLFLAKFAKTQLNKINSTLPLAKVVEFDDLETFEHTKCKPLSVILMVEYKTRRALGFAVAQMPAKGLLSHLALRKYGHREDHRPKVRDELFASLKTLVAEGALIKSDKNPHYKPVVKKHFPNSKHQTFKGRRGCVVGQGELKRGGFDPLFSLNHTCAKLRADINRLFRRTWCTTKKPERLADHIALMLLYHNYNILKKSRISQHTFCNILFQWSEKPLVS